MRYDLGRQALNGAGDGKRGQDEKEEETKGEMQENRELCNILEKKRMRT